MSKAVILAATVSACACIAQAAAPAAPTATFVQLHRGVAGKPAQAWANEFKAMREAGLDTVILQWTAQDGVAYFAPEFGEAQADGSERASARAKALEERYPEHYETVARILDAAGETDTAVYLGLHHDENYWNQITARERVIKDYFYVRVAQNIAVQQVLLDQFGGHAAWKGYYIPDEIDDINWRADARSALMRRYLKQLTQHLRENDPGRPILVSAFYRLRTAPAVFASNLRDLVSEAAVDAVMIQDGLGDGIPWKYAERYVPVYYSALQEAFGEEAPALWGIIEVFTRASALDEPFVAVPTEPERARTQVALAQGAFSRLVLFTYFDYASPEVGAAAKALHETLVDLAR